MLGDFLFALGDRLDDGLVAERIDTKPPSGEVRVLALAYGLTRQRRTIFDPLSPPADRSWRSGPRCAEHGH